MTILTNNDTAMVIVTIEKTTEEGEAIKEDIKVILTEADLHYDYLFSDDDNNVIGKEILTIYNKGVERLNQYEWLAIKTEGGKIIVEHDFSFKE